MSVPTIASVLLVAHESRQRVLASSLRVMDEPVSYTLETVEPTRLADMWAAPERWSGDLILIDGESVVDDDAREELLRSAYMHADRLSTVLYLSTRLPSEAEADLAFVWADDVVLPGWQFGELLRRRVQAIVLAPWRRATAIRAEAERRGDRCLRVIRPRDNAQKVEPATQAFAAHPERSLPPSIADHAHSLAERVSDLVSDAFSEGRRAGIASLEERVEQIGQQLVDERARWMETLSPERMAGLDAVHRVVPNTISPVATARFLGAVAAMEALRMEVRDAARELLRAEPQTRSVERREHP